MLRRTLRTILVVVSLIVIVLLLPALAANSGPAPQAALAGHIISGGSAGDYCVCGCDNCLCDPGEPWLQCNRMSVPGKDKPPAPGNSDSNPTPLMFIGAVIALLAWRLSNYRL